MEYQIIIYHTPTCWPKMNVILDWPKMLPANPILILQLKYIRAYKKNLKTKMKEKWKHFKEQKVITFE